MKRSNRILMAVAGIALSAWTAQAQAPAGPTQQAQPPAEQATATPAAPEIPPDQQATKEQMLKLFEAARIRQQMDSLQKMIPGAVQQQLQAQLSDIYAQLPVSSQPTPEQQARLDAMVKSYMQKATTVYTVDEMLSDVVPIYQRHISRSDADTLIAFYGSPTGQRLLDAQPAIMHEYMPLVMERVGQSSKQLNQEMKDEMMAYIKSAAPSTLPAENPAAK